MATCEVRSGVYSNSNGTLTVTRAPGGGTSIAMEASGAPRLEFAFNENGYLVGSQDQWVPPISPPTEILPPEVVSPPVVEEQASVGESTPWRSRRDRTA